MSDNPSNSSSFLREDPHPSISSSFAPTSTPTPTPPFSFSFNTPSTPTPSNPVEFPFDRQRMSEFNSHIPNHSSHSTSTPLSTSSVLPTSLLSSPTPSFSFHNHISSQSSIRSDMTSIIDKLNDRDLSMCNHYKREGNALFEKKEYEKACEQYTMALTYIPNDGSLYYQRSSCYQHMDKMKKALQDALKAVSIRPNYSRGYLQCAKCYIQTGMIEKYV